MPALRLRPLEADDVPVVASFLAHPDLVGRRGLDDDRPVVRSVTALTAAIGSQLEPEHGEAWGIDNGKLIGLVMVDWWWDAMTPWSHVVIDPAHQRKGHGTKAAWLVLDHLFGDTPAGIVEWRVPGWDEAGLAFGASLGALDIGRKRRAGIRDGEYFDEVGFAMPRATWEEARADRG